MKGHASADVREFIHQVTWSSGRRPTRRQIRRVLPDLRLTRRMRRLEQQAADLLQQLSARINRRKHDPAALRRIADELER